MKPYLVLIRGNATSEATEQEWSRFFSEARDSGLFRGGSEIGKRTILGNHQSAKSTDHLVGYLRFDATERQKIVDLLARHPVVLHGGSVELCELPES